MTQNTSFLRKIIYGCAIVVLLFPLFLLGQPATTSSTEDGSTTRGSSGGTLARMRASYGLSQAELGKIDPASETMKMATLGLRGIATNLLWTKANRYKMTESWDRLSATLNQIAKLQPNYITVWEFQAHNLAYNVSTEFDDYRHRYHWVKKGIEFLVEGTRYNQRNPRLFWNLGWFIGHKIGISDERKQFRRMFREDSDFHDAMADFVNMSEARGPDGYPDNWLVGYLWYLQSEAVVEKGVPVTWMRVDVNQEGYTDKRRSSVIFFSDPAMALISHADAITGEITPGEKTRNAWRRAGEAWEKYGALDIPTSWGHTIRLNTLAQYRENGRLMRAKLEELAPGLRDTMREERRAALPANELAAYDAIQNAAPTSEQELEAARRAYRKLIVTDLEVAERVPEELRAKARRFAIRSAEADAYVERISSYSAIVNYEYWLTRCEVEQSKVTADARRYMMFGDQEGAIANPEGARDFYVQAWDEWAKVFEKYPNLIQDTMAEDLQEVINRYRAVLDQLDEEFPKDFKLQMLLDEMAKNNPEAGGPPPDQQLSPGQETPQ